MRLTKIEKLEETDTYWITKASFKTCNTWFGKEYVEICISKKKMSSTQFFSTGKNLPVELWEPFRAFLESKMIIFKL